ncbi:hypothetical protein EDC45_0753 [Mesocricetibacter intestinalis]|uniref:Lipoprotein n=1 Tax=Mesocricetibacter intestinalis TaxID=1521930 RepID=A0A4R6VED2_9PAST|nr:hypothetical protein [Mesocricetibacter intestinalis]TDQ58961.1 hypothetical protein EDC45_0753 [Mesocricetibacter intestinalis]
MKKIILILSLFILSGCVDPFLLSYGGGHLIDGMQYWEHIDTKEEAPVKVRNDCFDKVNENNSFTEDKYGQCLYDQGYRFRTSNILYCFWYMPERCKDYNKFR